MDIQKKINALNSLIIINHDRIEGYKTAETEAQETDLKMLFSDLMETSIQNCKELVSEVKRLGGTPDEGTRITGKFFRVWMDVKAAFTGNDKKMILDSCQYGENVALETYKNILIQDRLIISPEEQRILNKQYEFLKADYHKIKVLITEIEQEKRFSE